MIIVFYVIFIITLSYTVLKKRKFDFFSIAVFSAFIYFFPGFLGVVRSGTGEILTIDNRVYICFITYLVMLQGMMLIADKKILKLGDKKIYSPIDYNDNLYSNSFENLSILVFELIGLVMMIYTIAHYGLSTGSFNKMELLSKTNKVTEYFKYIALFTFTYSFIAKGQFIRITRFLSLMLIGYTFLLGHRSFIVIGIIAIFMHYIGSVEPISVGKIIKDHPWAFISIIVSAVFFLFIKGVFAALMSGQYELVKSRLSSLEYYRNTFLESEANTITLNLQNVVTSGTTYPIGQYFMGLFGLIPIFGDKILNFFEYKSFETALNEQFNTQLSEGIGLGSTFLGEGYAIGNVIGVFFVLFLILILILFNISKRNNTQSIFSYVFFSIMLTYLTFYIHRNSLFFLLITGRAYLYIWFMAFIMKEFFQQIISINKT